MVQNFLCTPDETLEDLYKPDGCFPKIARSEYFTQASLMVIVLNTFWIAIDTDYNKADVLCEAPIVFQIGDNFFCTYFSIEIFVRMMSYKSMSHMISDAWFLFDAFL